MKVLETVLIPYDIRQMELYDDKRGNLNYRKFIDRPQTSAQYIAKQTALIHMEEAASSKHLKGFDIEDAKITVDLESQTFKVVSKTASKTV